MNKASPTLPSPPWRIGRNVPWSAAWSAEMAFALRPSTDFPGMTEVSQIDRQGQGEPLFAAIHVDRQRRGVSKLLCHVCGRATTAGDRWMFPVASGDFVKLHDGTEGFGCNVPPMHRTCALIATGQCPHLGRLVEPPFPWPREDTRLIWRTDVVPGMEALAATFPPGAEVVFSCYRLFGPTAAYRIRKARANWERNERARRSVPQTHQ
jgi:hypothetical protein